jgi:hypothetical protein
MDPVPAQADATEPTTVPHVACRSAWSGLIAKVYEVDLTGGSPMLYPRCGSEMKLIALITDPPEVRRIPRHLLKIGQAPPGLDPSALN